MNAKSKSLLSAFFIKNEVEIGFLTITLSWGYQNSFSAETRSYLSNMTPFYDYVANNFLNS